MKPALVILVAVAAAVAAAAATTLVLVPASTASAAPSVVDAPAPLAAEADARLARIEARQAELADALAALRAEAASADGPGRTPVGEIERVVARLLAERAAETGGAGGLADDGTAATAAGDAEGLAARPVDEIVTALLDGELDGLARAKLWDELTRSGRLDEVVAAFEERAERLADDPDAQVDLGTAYLQKIFEAGTGPAAGIWAMKADAAFDAALALDDRHWDARFNKAVSLAHWPAVFGKQPAAIEHFEVLAEQQEGLPAEPRFAQTYLLLGNVYQQVGQPDKAVAAWERGLARYPGNEALLGQLELAR